MRRTGWRSRRAPTDARSCARGTRRTRRGPRQGSGGGGGGLGGGERKAPLPIVASALLPIVFGLAGTDSVVADGVLIVAWGVFIADLVVHLRLVPRFLRT